MNLVGSQAHAVIFLHGFNHVVDQLARVRGLNLAAGDGSRWLSEHRMSETSDFQDRHEDTVSTRWRGAKDYGRGAATLVIAGTLTSKT
jgi:hypothetical protein